jgi:hypothetical protein
MQKRSDHKKKLISKHHCSTWLKYDVPCPPDRSSPLWPYFHKRVRRIRDLVRTNARYITVPWPVWRLP